MRKIKIIIDGKEIEAMIRERHIRKIKGNKLSWWERVKRWVGIKTERC